jgi:hypothetical protein
MHRCISLHVIISLVLSLLALALVLALALALTHSSHSSQATTGNSALGGWAVCFARSLGWSLAGWLAGRAGGRALAPTTTAETRVLKRTVISIYGDRGAPCICENAVL